MNASNEPMNAEEMRQYDASLYRWVRLKKHCEVTGETPADVHSRRRRGDWKDGEHCKVGSDGNLYVAVAAMQAVWKLRRPGEPLIVVHPEYPPQPTELYRHFDAHGVLLYVGISLSTAHRFSQHKSTSKWSKLVTRIEIEHFPSRAEALAAERKAISEEAPVHNIMHSNRQRKARPGVNISHLVSDPVPKESPLVKYFRQRGIKPKMTP